MTRTRNGTFSGLSIFDGDIDAPMFGRALKEIDQDLNTVYDRITGDNSPGSAPVIQVMDHSGVANSGSLLGIPLINYVAPFSAWSLGMPAADTATYGGDFYVIACPIFVPAGETTYALEVISAEESDFGFFVSIYDTTGALITEEAQMSYDETISSYVAYPQFVTTGALYYLFVRARVDDTTSNLSFRGCLMYPSRPLTPTTQPVFQEGAAQGGTDNPIPVPSATAYSAYGGAPTAVAAGSIAFETIHDAMFTDDYAIAGWIPTTLNLNIDAVYEALLGAPVDGNATVTNADSGSTDPATSRFIAHTQAGFGNEPKVDYPVMAEPVGCCLTTGDFMTDNTVPPVVGLLTRYAPFPRAVTESVGHALRLMMPDFQAADLRFSFLFVQAPGKGTPTNWQVRVKNVTSGVSSSLVSLTQLGTTPFYVATVTNADLTADALASYEMRMKSGGAFAFGEIAFLGWAAYFDP